MKKNTKIILIIICIMCLFLIGRKIYYKSLKIEPYKMYIESKITNKKIEVNSYSYQWNDKGIFVIGDGTIPKIEDVNECLKAKPGEKLYFTNYEDSTVLASFINIGDGSNFSISLECNNEENYFIVPNVVGKQMIGILLTSEEKGTANYAFLVDVSE